MINYKKDRIDLGYLPSDGEHLQAYVARLQAVLSTNRHSFAPSHENWFTHYGPSPCWICNFMDLSDYLASILQDFVTEDKKHKWVCEKPVGTAGDPMSFIFKPHSKVNNK